MIVRLGHRHRFMIKKNKKIHFVTLIEVIIAIGLVSILLVALLGVYHQIDSMHSEVDKTRLQNFRIRYIQTRLSLVFSNAVPKSDRDFYFYMSDDDQDEIRGNSLILAYDNGVDINPVFSNTVIGRLYLDRTGRLCLSTWPPPSRWEVTPPLKKEVLLDHVTELSFAFYVPPEREEKVIKDIKITSEEIQKEPDNGEWNKEWNLIYKQLPVMVRIIIKRDIAHGLAKPGEEIVFILPLPSSDKTILYRQ